MLRSKALSLDNKKIIDKKDKGDEIVKKFQNDDNDAHRFWLRWGPVERRKSEFQK